MSWSLRRTTSPTFATVAIQQSAGAAGAFECAGRAGRLPVLSGRACCGRALQRCRLAATAAPPPHGCRQQCRRQPPPPAAAASCRQHCSDSSLCCPGAAAATSVTATSAAAVSVAMAAAAARRASEELHMSVCVWRLCGASVLAEKPQVFRIPNALRVCLEERSDESVRSGPSLLGAAPPRAVSRDSVGAG